MGNFVGALSSRTTFISVRLTAYCSPEFDLIATKGLLLFGILNKNMRESPDS